MVSPSLVLCRPAVTTWETSLLLSSTSIASIPHRGGVRAMVASEGPPLSSVSAEAGKAHVLSPRTERGESGEPFDDPLHPPPLPTCPRLHGGVRRGEAPLPLIAGGHSLIDLSSPCHPIIPSSLHLVLPPRTSRASNALDSPAFSSSTLRPPHAASLAIFLPLLMPS